MKKLLLILFSVFVIGGIYYYKQEDSKSIQLENNVYIKNNKIYSISTDKPVTGYTVSTSWGNKYYTKYNKGIMTSQKKVSNDLQLLSEDNFNKNGLLEGESFKFLRNETIVLKYKNNILNGKGTLNNKDVEFNDGTLVGKNGISEYENLYKINYINGVPDFIKIKIPNNKYPKKILYNGKLTPNFTGGILKKIDWKIVLSEYENGKLMRERFYSTDSNIIGLKEKDIIYDGNNKIRQELFYRNGTLEKLNSYNDKMEKNGENIEKTLYSGEFFIKNYENGILNGNSTQYLFDKNKNLKVFSGFYKLGIYTGERYTCGYDGTYLNGFNVDKLNNSIKFKPFKIENLTTIPKEFTGYNKDGNKIYEYESGEIKKEYIPTDNIYQQVKIYNKDGSYKENTYQNGLILEVINYDKNNIPNGEYIGYAHNKLKGKTVGMIVDDVYTGKFKHYHGDELIYFDTYDGNTKSTRVNFYNYKENKIKSIEKRVFKNGIWKVVNSVGYDTDGNIINESKNLNNNKPEKYNEKKYDDLLFDTVKKLNN
ncbi:hypothetical protein [Cetobacterium ceti]